jgi:SRSO17 transposase
MPDLVAVDASYGMDTAFLELLRPLGFKYVVGITWAMRVWSEGQAPLLPKPWSGCCRKPKLLRRYPAQAAVRQSLDRARGCALLTAEIHPAEKLPPSRKAMIMISMFRD